MTFDWYPVFLVTVVVVAVALAFAVFTDDLDR